MKRSMFGDLRPIGSAEMTEAFDERGASPDNCNAEITGPEDDGFGTEGYSAEVRDNETGDAVFTTLAYETEAMLRADLRRAGIADADIDVMDQ